MIAGGTVYISGAPDRRRERPHDVCVMMRGKCICNSADHCQDPSTRIYSLNDPKLDKCWNELPCPDHATIADRTDSNGKVWSDADICGMRFVAYGRHVDNQPTFKFSLELAIQDYRDRYRMAVREEAT